MEDNKNILFIRIPVPKPGGHETPDLSSLQPRTIPFTPEEMDEELRQLWISCLQLPKKEDAPDE